MKLCQCWDDGIVDDIRLCEVLRRHGATASFNLNAGKHRAERYHDWDFQGTKAVWKLSRDELAHVYRGFTIANHTLTHPHLTRVDDAQLAREIAEGRQQLRDLVGQEVLGFAYPFGDHDDRVARAVRAAGHVYARTCNNVPAVLPAADAMKLGTSCHFLAPDFWPRYDAVKQAGGVFYFWGHSYEIVSEADWWDFDRKIARMSADDAAEWVDLPKLFA
jgi:peptidoglycan/xylan/chitin deacetylase (PgdA/CDA1 family)